MTKIVMNVPLYVEVRSDHLSERELVILSKMKLFEIEDDVRKNLGSKTFFFKLEGISFPFSFIVGKNAIIKRT
jgi:hypothetical protein